jgi:predicted HTH domain antitoxin
MKSDFATKIADILVTIGKAIKLSGLTRYEFEKYLAKKGIPVCNTTVEEVFQDLEKLKGLE